jgi:hypothetical protein
VEVLLVEVIVKLPLVTVVSGVVVVLVVEVLFVVVVDVPLVVGYIKVVAFLTTQEGVSTGTHLQLSSH